VDLSPVGETKNNSTSQ